MVIEWVSPELVWSDTFMPENGDVQSSSLEPVISAAHPKSPQLEPVTGRRKWPIILDVDEPPVEAESPTSTPIPGRVWSIDELPDVEPMATSYLQR